MVINTNVGALSTMRTLTESTSKLNKALSRLASGSKIVNPADDAAGLAVANKFDAQISRNVRRKQPDQFAILQPDPRRLSTKSR